MLNESHSTMKLVAFWQASASSAPPLNSGLLAMKPTLLPSSRASTVAIDLPKRSFSSKLESVSAIAAITLRTSYTWLRDSGTISSIFRHASSEPGRHRMLGRRLHVVARQVGEKPLDRVERLLVGVHRHVGETRDAGQELPAAELLGVDRLADRDRGDAGARDRHDRALAHHDEIRHRGIPGRGAVALARAAPTPTATRAGAGTRSGPARGWRGPRRPCGRACARRRIRRGRRAACRACRGLLHVPDLLHVDRRCDDAPSTVKSLDTMRDFAPVDAREARDLAVRRASCAAPRRGCCARGGRTR